MPLPPLLQRTLFGLVAAASLLLGAPVRAEVAHIAVAANFAEPIEALAKELKTSTGHELRIATGPSGSLYAQIINGAPFDVFLSADEQRPTALAGTGLVVAGSQFTYAVGQLALWAPKPGLDMVNGRGLLNSSVGKVAAANPKLAPYGLAADQTLQSLGIEDAVRPKLIRGNSIGQAFAMVASGNAEAGFVAMSQLLTKGETRPGSVWLVPATLHAPIRQDAVLLKRGEFNPAALALLKLLQQPATRETLATFGYR